MTPDLLRTALDAHRAHVRAIYHHLRTRTGDSHRALKAAADAARDADAALQRAEQETP